MGAAKKHIASGYPSANVAFQGRGAQVNPANPFQQNQIVQAHIEGLDEAMDIDGQTEFLSEFPKKIINAVSSPDIPFAFSMNPYQGCEHGCVYCYARTTHQYWGYSAGLDFERKILVKENAAELFEKALMHPKWKGTPVMLSGNTDCYQPVERKKELTRSLLQVALRFRQPVGIITKNSLVVRDLDLLQELARLNLVKVAISITTLDPVIRRTLEPRTSTAVQRLATIERLHEAGVPVSVMVAPVIPGLTSHEIPDIIREAAARGAHSANYTMLRLNGPVALVFENWIRQTFPDRADKVLDQVRTMHQGNLGSSQFGARMRGQGQMALFIRNLFQMARDKYLLGRGAPQLETRHFSRPPQNGQLALF